MRLKNGENHLTQWDRHQVLVFTEYPPGTELHMWCDFFDGNALKFYTDDNREVVVPDVLLQVSGSLRVCVFATKYGVSYTQVRYIVPVEARPRPADYVYTPEENRIWETKLNKNLGAENAGKLLSVGDDGNVTTVKDSSGQEPPEALDNTELEELLRNFI